MRTKFKLLETGDVELTYVNPWGEVFFDTFSVYQEGGYVRSSNGKQVCDHLRCSGETLSCGKDGLLKTIKREFRKMQKEDRREYDKI